MRGREPLRFGLSRMPDGAAKRHKPSAGTRETPVAHKPPDSTTSRTAASRPPFVPPHKPGDTVVNRPFCVRFFSRRQGHWGTIRSLPRTANVRSRTSPCMGLPPTVAELCAAEGEPTDLCARFGLARSGRAIPAGNGQPPCIRHHRERAPFARPRGSEAIRAAPGWTEPRSREARAEPILAALPEEPAGLMKTGLRTRFRARQWKRR